MAQFGTDGIRGRSGRSPIDLEGARRIGGAAVRWAHEVADGEAPRVLVGRDTRLSGASLGAIVCGSVTLGGGIAVDAQVLPTGALMAALAAGVAHVGVMITASHNPAHDNGFKVLGPGGHKPDAARARILESWMGAGPEKRAGGGREAGRDLAWQAYTSAFSERVGPLAAWAGKTVVVDLAHGAAVGSLDWLRSVLPDTTVHAIGAGDGVINDGVGSEHPAALCAAVLEHGADAGLAVDGDGDRCRLVDERGQVVHGDALAWMLAQTLPAEAGMAVTIMATRALEASMPERRVVRTPVGDTHLAAAMRREGLALGVETSGHALFADGLVGGDGLFTGLRGLAAAWSRAARVSEAVGGFVPFSSSLTAVPVRERPPLESVSSLQAAVEQAEAQLGPGRVLLRYSGTEDVLRVFVEGPDGAVVTAAHAAVHRAAEDALGKG